jgi:hypothetical protein
MDVVSVQAQEADAPDEIEITPEMIAAGARPFWTAAE